SESASILAAGESIEESFDLQKFGVKRGGGELTLTRQINDKEVSLIIKVEE
ncbi:MAG: hypothetical protein PWP24_1610, partial [Clostridiales bacterium]|nr:hypothetical protein [Clostridiales bacterium]